MRMPVIPFVIALTLAPGLAMAQPQCQGPEAGHFGAEALCLRLAPMIVGRPEAFSLLLTQDRPRHIAARLTWQSGARSGQSPEIEIHTQDRLIDDRAADRLLRTLLNTASLP